MYDGNLLIKIPESLKEKIKERAEENCQNMSDYVRGLIVKDLKEDK